MAGVLKYSDGINPIQAMVLSKSGVNKTSASGALTTVRLIYCVVTGGFTITWNDNTTSNIATVEGESFVLDSAKSVTITSGTFHIA